MLRAFVLVLALLAPATLFAQATSKPPVNINNQDRYIRIGAPYWGIDMAVLTTTRPVRNNQSGAVAISDLRLFAFDSVISMSCIARAKFCFSQTATAALNSGTQFGHIYDLGAQKFGQTAGTSGVGPCWVVEPGIPYDKTLFRDIFQGPQASTVAARDGVCISSASVADGWPCNATADCSSGTCSTATLNGRSAKARQKGAFLLSIAAAATTCAIWQEY